MIIFFLAAALTEELEALQLATNKAARALNARGDLVVSHLHEIPEHTEEIALHGVCHGATVALMTTQVNSGNELRWLQPSFASGDDHHDLVESFTGHVDAASDACLA